MQQQAPNRQVPNSVSSMPNINFFKKRKQNNERSESRNEGEDKGESEGESESESEDFKNEGN